MKSPQPGDTCIGAVDDDVSVQSTSGSNQTATHYELGAYLRRTGWTKAATIRRDEQLLGEVWRHTGINETVWLPLDDELGDYYRRIRDGIDSIAKLEKRSVESVRHTLLAGFSGGPVDNAAIPGLDTQIRKLQKDIDHLTSVVGEVKTSQAQTLELSRSIHQTLDTLASWLDQRLLRTAESVEGEAPPFMIREAITRLESGQALTLAEAER